MKHVPGIVLVFHPLSLLLAPACGLAEAAALEPAEQITFVPAFDQMTPGAEPKLGGPALDDSPTTPSNPEDLQAEPDPQGADLSCARDCVTYDDIGGSAGHYVYLRSCNIGSVPAAFGGGCNITDAEASHVRLTESYPYDVDTWKCGVYTTTSATFDLQVCCMSCDLDM